MVIYINFQQFQKMKIILYKQIFIMINLINYLFFKNYLINLEIYS